MNPVIQTALRFLFSQVGLCLLVVGYAALGAFMFYSIEEPAEFTRMSSGKTRAAEIEVERRHIVWTINEWNQCFLKEEKATAELIATNEAQNITFTQLDILKYMAKRTCRNDQILTNIKDILDEYQRNISSAISMYKYNGKIPEGIFTTWTFSSALVFTITTITLIGYGHIAPSGDLGRIMVIFYSLLGIPLTLMFLANIGKLFAAAIRLAYGKGCCYPCWRRRKDHESVYVLDREDKFSHRVGDIPPQNFKPALEQDVDHGEEIRRYNEGRGAASGEIHYDVNEQDMGEFAAGLIEEDRAGDILRDGSQPVPIALTVGIILSYVGIGAAMFSAWEGWPKITSLYFSFVTLTTLGFGDFVPGFTDNSSMGQFKLVVASAYIIIGLAVLSMGFDLIVTELVFKARVVGKMTGIVETIDADGDGIDDDLQKPKVSIKGNIAKASNRFNR